MRTELATFVEQVFASGKADNTSSSNLVLLLGPAGIQVPDDGFLTYKTLDSLRDVGLFQNRDVILFREDQADMLRVLSQHYASFHVTAQTLFGLPGIAYEPWFDDATFGLERVSYSTLISELSAAKTMYDQLEAANASGTEMEARRYRTADGRVRFDQRIGVASDHDGEATPDADSDDSTLEE